MGKPHQLKKVGRSTAQDTLAEAPSLAAAARQLGVDPSTLRRWRRAGKLEPSAVKAFPRPKGRGPLTVSELLDGPRPGPDDPDRDAAWRALRRDIDAARMCTDLDPRCGLCLEGARRDAWIARVRALVVRLVRRRKPGGCNRQPGAISRRLGRSLRGRAISKG